MMKTIFLLILSIFTGLIYSQNASKTKTFKVRKAVNKNAKQDTFPEDMVIEFAMQEKDESAPVFIIVEEMPEYPGGDQELRKFIAQTVKYPAMAQELGVQGRVYVSFVVNPKGVLEQVRVARGVDPELDKEALRVVKAMPKWKPGKQRGKEVTVSYTVPVNFVLQ